MTGVVGMYPNNDKTCCIFYFQIFISEPSMVKLIHFQGYPIQLLPMVASGVPSIHIAMDFIPELLSQAQLDKQVRLHHLYKYSSGYMIPVA